jgi:hypothetical protein
MADTWPERKLPGGMTKEKLARMTPGERMAYLNKVMPKIPDMAGSLQRMADAKKAQSEIGTGKSEDKPYTLRLKYINMDSGQGIVPGLQTANIGKNGGGYATTEEKAGGQPAGMQTKILQEGLQTGNIGTGGSGYGTGNQAGKSAPAFPGNKDDTSKAWAWPKEHNSIKQPAEKSAGNPAAGGGKTAEKAKEKDGSNTNTDFMPAATSTVESLKKSLQESQGKTDRSWEQVIQNAKNRGYSADQAGVTQLVLDSITKPENVELYTVYKSLDDPMKELVDWTIAQQDFAQGENTLKGGDLIGAELMAKVQALLGKSIISGDIEKDTQALQDAYDAVYNIAMLKHAAEQDIEAALGVDSIRGRQTYGWGERVGGGALLMLADAGLGAIDGGNAAARKLNNAVKYPMWISDQLIGTNSTGMRDLLDQGTANREHAWQEQSDLTRRYAQARGGYNTATGVASDLLRVATNVLTTAGVMLAPGAATSTAGGTAAMSVPTAGARRFHRC